MTDTAPAPRRSGGRTALIVVLAIAGALVLAAVVVGAILVAVARGGTGQRVTDEAEAAAGDRVVVDVANGALRITTGSDDSVHAELEADYVFGAPSIDVATGGDVTRVTGGCPTTFFTICTAEVAVTLPAGTVLEVRGVNGDVVVTGRPGAIDIATTNGSILVTAPAADVVARTTNGRVEVTGARAASVEAGTVNGAIELAFADAPDEVRATSTNGSVSVVVPGDDEYAIEVDTVNGDTDIVGVLNDPGASRTITATTVNGSVEVRGG